MAPKGSGGNGTSACTPSPRARQLDLLAYVAYTRAPISRGERAVLAKAGINASYKSNRQLDFLEFVLGHNVDEGVDELDMDKLPRCSA